MQGKPKFTCDEAMAHDIRYMTNKKVHTKGRAECVEVWGRAALNTAALPARRINANKLEFVIQPMETLLLPWYTFDAEIQLSSVWIRASLGYNIIICSIPNIKLSAMFLLYSCDAQVRPFFKLLHSILQSNGYIRARSFSSQLSPPLLYKIHYALSTNKRKQL